MIKGKYKKTISIAFVTHEQCTSGNCSRVFVPLRRQLLSKFDSQITSTVPRNVAGVSPVSVVCLPKRTDTNYIGYYFREQFPEFSAVRSQRIPTFVKRTYKISCEMIRPER